MTVPNQNPVSSHVGNGVSTAFSYGFMCLAAKDMTVLINYERVVSGFVIQGLGSKVGGTVVFDVPPASGVSVILTLDVVLERQTDYQYNGDFQAPTVNNDFDRLWLALQGVDGKASSSLRFPPGEQPGYLPPIDARKGKALIFNPVTGKPEPSQDNYNDQAAIASAAAQASEQAARNAELSRAGAAQSAAAASASKDQAEAALKNMASYVTVDPIPGLDAQNVQQALETMALLGGGYMLQPIWCPTRDAIWPGCVPADGQLLPRALFPDAAANITGPTPGAPVVTDAQWLANPELRASYTPGDGSNTIRMPDYNGKSPGSLGALVMRGDGALSAGVDGVIQRDAMQRITGSVSPGVGNNTSYLISGTASGSFTLETAATSRYLANGDGVSATGTKAINFDSALVARTAGETRALNATGCWVIRLFGVVANPGSADAAQLATDYAALASGLQALQAKVGSTLIYPNGGSAASPASLAINSRYVEANPFPGYRVSAVGEILVSGEWQQVGFSAYASTNSLGIAVTQLQDGRLMVETGISAFVSSLVLHGYSGATRPNITTPTPARVRVWKIGAA
ncbi:hypothetical protein [Bordetella avium]|uniref:hypothetical protein n=1 Tax=Bordetella avium TaxID=521 RepID=UPI0011C42A96|nr:hypothetical protein [Bordetella avium]